MPGFSDPVPFGRGDTPLEQIAATRETWTDRFLQAIDDEAEAHNAYLFQFSVAYAAASETGIAATVRARHAGSQEKVVAAEQEWNRAKAAKERCRAKVDELADRNTAAMSWQRAVNAQT